MHRGGRRLAARSSQSESAAEDYTGYGMEKLTDAGRTPVTGENRDAMRFFKAGVKIQTEIIYRIKTEYNNECKRTF